VRGAYSEAAPAPTFRVPPSRRWGSPSGEPGLRTASRRDAQRAGPRAGFVPVENSIAGPVGINTESCWKEGCSRVLPSPTLHRALPARRPGERLGGCGRRDDLFPPDRARQCATSSALPWPAPPVPSTTPQALLRSWRGASSAESRLPIRLEACADVYGLAVLAEDIQSVQNNITRFLAFHRRMTGPCVRGERRRASPFSVHHHPGALLDCLSDLPNTRST